MFNPDALKQKKDTKEFSFKCRYNRVETEPSKVYANTRVGIVCQECMMELIAKRK